MNGLSEMQLLRERIEQNQFSCLKLYPNKALLGRSKAIKFANNNDYFEERCQLFIEHAYLLLRVEVEQRPAFLSQNTFINHLGEVYLFYSFDPAHQNRLIRVSPGALLSALVSAFHRVLPINSDPILDCEHHSLFENTLHCLIPYLDDLRERSENYYYQSQGEISCSYEFRHEPSNPFSVLAKLEGSDLFREYNFPLKYNTAVLARGVIEEGSQLRGDYIRLWEAQQVAVREAMCLDGRAELAGCVFGYYLRLFNYLQLLQNVYFLKVTVSQIELEAALEASTTNGVPSCTLTFQANLKKEPHVNRTSNDKSSESSIRNDKELTKEEKKKLQRSREYLESLAIFKSRINFTVWVAFKGEGFEVTLEAVSLWTIDEIYYYHFLDFWGSFINHWHNAACHFEAIHERVATLRFQLFHRNKNIGMKTVMRVPKDCNLAEQLIVAYDQVVLLLLLLEPVLKKMYKVGYQLTSFSEKGFEELRQTTFIEQKANKLRHSLKRYTRYHQELAGLSKE